MEQRLQLHFKVDASLYNDIVRNAYWFEQGKQKWALNVLRCLEGITFAQERSFLLGDAIFENCEDSVSLINFKDNEFKKRLQDFFFGHGKMEVPEDDLEKANFSGWLTQEGFFIRCESQDHLIISKLICEKLNLVDGIYSKNFERNLELSGAIKISCGTVLTTDVNKISGKQIEVLLKYIDDGGELNSGGLKSKMSKEELLDWIDFKLEEN